MATSDSEEYLAVLKASYDYEPQSDEELTISEGQLLFLLERTDDDWWKVKIKPDSQDEDSPSGLVPSAYVEPADHTRTVKALYDYEARAPGELSVSEDDLLLVYATEDAWILVMSEEKGKAGFVPENYVEEAEDEESAAAPPQIVIPDSPPRPTGTYVDPADRVASAKAGSSASAADAIQTWPVTEIDKKGKKRKGTLVVGSGSFYFASESDKAAVQKWATTSITDMSIEKSKHVHISTTSAGTGTDLHFNVGSSSNADTIIAKLKSSRALAQESHINLMSRPTPPPEEMRASPASALRMANGGPPKNANVRFAPAGPMFIPPSPEPSEDGGEEPEVEEEPEEIHPEVEEEEEEAATSDAAVALYDFTADGDDELSVTEGETLLVLERDGDEWWKVRNMQGQEGVVPASYVEPVGPQSATQTTSPSPSSNTSAKATAAAAATASVAAAATTAAAAQRAKAAAAKKEAQEAADRAEAERLQAEEEEAERAEEEAREAEEAAEKRRAERAEKAAKEKEAKRKRDEKEKRERERVRAAAAAEEAENARKAEEKEKDRRSTERERQRSSANGNGEVSRPPRSDSKRSSAKSRIWHDRSGQFRVEAVFLGMNGDKLRLHKSNGVVIEVPSVKMSDEDMRYIEKATKKSRRDADDDDDVPLGERRPSRSAQPSTASTSHQQKKGPRIDWFEFFLSAGCDVDDCTRYASSFERDKMDASILPDITDATMRSLGLREGDIIRVGKAIAQRAPKKVDPNAPPQPPTEVRQAATSPAPNLFAVGPGGQLKAPRRGRPPPSKSASQGVDLAVISSASDQIARTSSPTVITPSAASSLIELERPPRSSSALTSASGFDDDAWTNRPSSTKPLAPTPAAVPARTASAPPTAAPPPVAPPVAPPVPPVPAPVPTTTTTKSNSVPSLANTTESDIFDQLARLSALKPTPAPPAPSPPVVPSPISPASPAGYRQGMGMGPSPVPIGQLSAQPTGIPQQQNGPRGPYAPVPSNQTLLQPLIPTTTGFNSFVPLRPSATGAFPSFQAQPQQQSFQALPQQQQPSFLSSQPTGFGGPSQPSFLQSQPTGFSPAPSLFAQNTGFFPQSPSPFGSGTLMSQPTGAQSGSFASPGQYQNNGNFGQVQNNFTGFNPGIPSQFNNAPPVPPLPQSISAANVFAQMKQNPPANTSPANIFAQMKSGTFANDAAPQPTEKYEALRTQPTGWGYQNGY